MRIDAHVHVGASDTGQAYYPTLTGPEWLDLARAAGIDRGVVFPPTMDAGYRASNERLRDWAAGVPDRIRVLARLGGRRLPLAEPRGWLVRRAARRAVMPRPLDLIEGALAGFAGVKLLPQLDGIPGRRTFEEIADLRLPVLSHSGRFVPARWLARAVVARTTGPVILAHLGAFPAERDLIDEALDLALAQPRVHLDTSGIWETALLARAIERAPHKLVFGSDCPLTHPGVAWDQVARLIPDPGLARRIGGELAAEIFP
jgi:hypothetical protein